MEETNVYQTPAGELSQGSDEYADMKFFTFAGRLGRLRYIAYAFGIPILMIALLGIAAAVLVPMSETFGGAVAVVGGIGILLVCISFGLRRLHDLDKSGWWMLLLIVPLVNIILALYMIFARGVKGSNQYGLETPANSTGVKVTATLCAIYYVGSIIAAITVPALFGIPAG